MPAAFTPFAERARRVNLCQLPPPVAARVRSQIEAELSAAAAEAAAAVARRAAVAYHCWYDGAEFVPAKRYQRYCCAACRVAACRAKRRPL